MIYCKKCILPSSRPKINFNKLQICDACGSSGEKKNIINWEIRKVKFYELVKETKAKKCFYDCIIPVSGGKDSTWQVITALEYGLNPLCVTWKTPARNSLGFSNLQNLIHLGVNHIDFSINPKVEKQFTFKAFERFGIPLIPMHMALHAIPLQIAVNFKIPLILWGENSAYEYGGKEKYRGVRLNHNWLKKYGVTNGTTAEDWIDHDLSKESLSPYFWPSDEQQKKADVFAIFMGHYFNWDPLITYEVSK